MSTSRRSSDKAESISRSRESISGRGIVEALFAPCPWLPGPHLQSIWGNLTRSRRLVPYRREIWETPDGDELVLDRVDGPPDTTSPRLLVLHGLEGSSESVYVQGMMALVAARGWRGVALNFRSCARTPGDHSVWIPNRRPRLYHSGETTDLAFVLSRLAEEAAEEDPRAPLFAAGVSLGGNVLLKWLGENPGQRVVAAAAVISVPFDLGAGGLYMETGLGPFYTRHLLSTLKIKAADLAARFPEAAAKLDVPKLERARTFFEFDDAGTAPLHGFAGARDYYERSSSLGFVGRVATPTLAISALDDPFLPPSVLDAVGRAKSDALDLVTTRRGGHAGFVGGTWRPRYWAEERAVGWLAKTLERL